MNELTPKVYELDLGFILDNYLEPKSWGKRYTLYKKGELQVDLRLVEIDCYNKKLLFRITAFFGNDNAYEQEYSNVHYYLENEEYTFDILKNEIVRQAKISIQNAVGKVNFAEEYEKLYELREEERKSLEYIFDKEEAHKYEDFLEDDYFDVDEIKNMFVENQISSRVYLFDYREAHYKRELVGFEEAIKNNPLFKGSDNNV